MPETVEDLGTNDKLNDAEMSDGTERKAAADAAAKEEAIKAAAEAAAREEELRQARLRAEMKENEREEERARAERERAPKMVRGAFMAIGTLPAVKKLIVKLGLVSEATLSGLLWMEMREIVPGTKSQRSWFFEVDESKVVEASAAAGRHAYIRTPAGEMWKFCPLTFRRRAPTGIPRAASTWSRATAPARAPEPVLHNWHTPTGSMWPEGTQRPTYAQAARRDEAKDDVTTVLAAFKREFHQEMMKEMQAFADKMVSAQAAATPVAAVAKDVGQAGDQALRAEVNALKQKVDELTKSKEFGQGLYQSTFNLLQAATREIEQQKVRILELELKNPFVTPVKFGPATMTGLMGGQFSAGAGAGGSRQPPSRLLSRRPTREQEQERSLGGFSAYTFTPFVPPEQVAPGAPEGASGGVPLSAAATGTQAAPDEKVGQEDESEKWHDAKEKEEGQPAATVAPVAAAAPAGAAGCPQGKEGTGSKVRLPDRQPGESGVTPDAKVTRSAEPVGAASSEEEAGGLAPMRLNSNFSAAAGQAEMSDQNRC